jgi:hypothetical protein
VKKLAWAAFFVLDAVFAVMFVIAIWGTLHDEQKDPAEIAARKEQCRQLERHIFELSPKHDKSVDELVAGVPIEDIEQCAAADKDKKTGVDRKPQVIACMMASSTLDAVKGCVPKPAE